VTWIVALIALLCVPWLYLLGRWAALQLRRRRDLFTSFYRRERSAMKERQRVSRL
jgi:hypothetical protein